MAQTNNAAEKKLLLATGNAHKVAEIQAIFTACGLREWQLLTLADFPGYQPPPEDGTTFALNAALKARHAAAMSGLMTLADDSGLCVDKLDGAPGVYSARYAGPEQDDAKNRHKLLAMLQGLELAERQASFRCCVAIAYPDLHQPGELDLWIAEGRLEGQIALAELGEHGFGYDNLFYLPDYKATVAELSPELKNSISHRRRAVEKAAQWLAEGCYLHG